MVRAEKGNQEEETAMTRVQDQAPPLTAEEKDWIRRNLEEQQVRHDNIVADMDALAPQRDAWIDGFFERLQTRGFNYNCDNLRVIDKDELPQQPNRKFKVVF